MLWTAPCWWSLCLPNRAHHLPTALECPQLVHGRILLLLSSDDSRVRFCQFLLLQIPSSSRKHLRFMLDISILNTENLWHWIWIWKIIGLLTFLFCGFGDFDSLSNQCILHEEKIWMFRPSHPQKPPHPWPWAPSWPAAAAEPTCPLWWFKKWQWCKGDPM